MWAVFNGQILFSAKMGQMFSHLLFIALPIVPVIGQSPGVQELLLRNELLYESIRNSFTFDILDEVVDDVNVLPMEVLFPLFNRFISHLNKHLP
jgi:hypothetical protein